jgi:S1-C subfamily serine protease
MGAVALGALCGCARGLDAGGGRLYQAVRRASVSILVNGRHQGSGFFADAEGLIVTAAHVIRGKDEGIEVLSPVAGRLPAEKVAVDMGHDIGLLRVPEREEPYPALRVASAIPEPAARVFLFGDPLFRRHLLLTGSMAVAEPTYCYDPGVSCYVRALFMAGAAPQGTSGGCWVDSAGRVVGVQGGYLNTAKKAPVGVAYAAPPDEVQALLASRRSTATPTLGTWLENLWTQPTGYIARFPKGTVGVVTVKPEKGGPVAEAGLSNESLITALDGTPIHSVRQLLAAVRAKQPGDEVTLEVLDPDGKPRRTVTIRLAKVAE